MLAISDNPIIIIHFKICFSYFFIVMSNIGCYFLSYQILKQDDESVHIGFGNNSVVLTNEPFRLDFLVNKEVVVSVNARGLMNFEEYREKRYLIYLFKVHKNQFYIV